MDDLFADPRLTTMGLLFEAHEGLLTKLEPVFKEHGISGLDLNALTRLSRSPGRRLRMSDLATQTSLSTSGITRLVDRLARNFPVDRVAVAGSAENQVSFARVDEGRIEAWRTAQEEWVGPVAISPDGLSLATGSVHHTVSAIDTETGETRFRHAWHDGAVMAVAWSPDGKVLASGGADALIYLADGDSGARRGVLRQVRSAVTALAFDPRPIPSMPRALSRSPSPAAAVRCHRSTTRAAAVRAANNR